MTEMKRRLAQSTLVVAGLLALAAAPTLAKGGSDAQIKDAIIKQSIASYPGNCPCPYNTASNGSRCGKRSAWNRAGGYAPKCYPDDVTPEDVKRYRAGDRD